MDVHMESPAVGVSQPLYPSAPLSPDYEVPDIILTIPSGVVLYYINKDGNVVTTLPSPTFLQIFRSPDYQELGLDDRPAAYVVVRNGEWSYPLIPKKSPIYLSKTGIFTFPDASFGDVGHAVAIVFNQEVSDANKKIFKDIVEAYGVLKREGDSGSGGGGGTTDGERKSFTETAVLKGAELIGKGIVIGAKAAEYGLQKGAEAAQRYMEPEPGKQVDPKIVKGVEYAKKGSEVTKKAAGKVEGWVGDATRSLGRSLSRLVFGVPDKTGGSGGSGGSGSSGTMQQIRWILKLGLQGMGVVFSALDDAKEILKKSIKTETVKVVDYKYGADAAVVAAEASDAFGNLVDTADSAMSIGLSKKAFAKKVVKKTGKAMAKEAVSGAKTNNYSVTLGQDGEGRVILSSAPEAAPACLNRVKATETTPGSPERSRSPLPSGLPPPRPTSLPATAPPIGTSGHQRHAQFTDDEVEALLALAPTPTHDTIHHALDLPSRERPPAFAETTQPNAAATLYPRLN